MMTYRRKRYLFKIHDLENTLTVNLNTVTTKQKEESWERLLTQQASVESSSPGIFPVI